MAAFDDTFQRIEKKYHLNTTDRTLMEQRLGTRLQRDDARDGMVYSLYFDTADHLLITRSLDKPLYKEKLRLRAYGQEAGCAMVRAFAPEGARITAQEAALPVFLEMKKKFDGVVYKRRVKMSLAAAQALLALGATFEEAMRTYVLEDEGARSARMRQAQIAREIEAFLARYTDLKPTIAIRCWREAWKSPTASAGNVRITFDGQLAYCDIETPQPAVAGCAKDRPWTPIIEPDDSIMEVKCAGAYPLWLARLLSDARLFPQSFSKYGKAAMLAYVNQPALTDGTHIGTAAGAYAGATADTRASGASMGITATTAPPTTSAHSIQATAHTHQTTVRIPFIPLWQKGSIHAR